MASAWGKSWASAWGNSWGVIAEAVGRAFVPSLRRTVLVTVDGNRFIVPVEDAHKWIRAKVEEVEEKPKLRKLAMRKISKARIEKEAPKFVVKTSDTWLRGLVEAANRQIVERVLEIRREIEAEDEIIFLMAA